MAQRYQWAESRSLVERKTSRSLHVGKLDVVLCQLLNVDREKNKTKKRKREE